MVVGVWAMQYEDPKMIKNGDVEISPPETTSWNHQGQRLVSPISWIMAISVSEKHPVSCRKPNDKPLRGHNSQPERMAQPGRQYQSTKRWKWQKNVRAMVFTTIPLIKQQAN